MASAKLHLVLGAAALCACSALVPLAHGEVYYRWINERGNEVHSDRPPPPGIDYEVTRTGSTLKRVVDADEGAVPAEVKPRVGNEFTSVDEAAAKRSKKNPELCTRAKSNLDALTSGSQVETRDVNGEKRFLTDEEILIERAKAEAEISVYCP